jgi:endonuclease/exonuclease/phosphatase family metal-dependent hydrolase
VRRGALTFPSRLPMIRIDHLFISPSVEVSNMHAPDGALTKLASDHLPLVADFAVNSVK